MKSKWNELDLKDHNGAAAIILNNKGKILCMKNTKHNKIGLPGGKAEPDESTFDCLVRETKEEIGVDIVDCKFLNSFVHQYRRDNKLISVDIHLYFINIYDGEICNKEPELCTELLYLDPKTILCLPRDYIMDNLWEAVIQLDYDGYIVL